MSMDALVKARVALLLKQMDAERPYGWQTDLARQVWNDTAKQSHLHQLLRGKKGAGLKTAEQLARGIGLDMRFFTDETLGDAPDYREWATHGARPATESLDRSTADDLPSDWEADVKWAIESAELRPNEARDFRAKRRSMKFPVGRTTLLALAEECKAGRKADAGPPDESRARPDDGTFDLVGEIRQR